MSISFASSIELDGCDDNGPAAAVAALRHIQCNSLNFGPVPFKYLEEYFVGTILPFQSFPDQQSGLRDVALLKNARVADVKVDEVTADYGHNFLPLGELSASGIQVFISDNYAVAGMANTPQFAEGKALYLGPVSHIDFDELAVARFFTFGPLSIQKCSSSYSTPFGISTELDNEIHVVATNNGHDGNPPRPAISMENSRVDHQIVAAAQHAMNRRCSLGRKVDRVILSAVDATNAPVGVHAFRDVLNFNCENAFASSSRSDFCKGQMLEFVSGNTVFTHRTTRIAFHD